MAESTIEAVRSAVATLLREILDGSSEGAGWVLNPSDPGLLGSLAEVSASDASVVPAGGSSSTAAHAEHLRYGLSLLNAIEPGKNPFAEADWSIAWRTRQVSDEEWARIRAGLADEAATWQARFTSLLDAGELELTGVLASVAHLAYHLGAIRQITPGARGPAHNG